MPGVPVAPRIGVCCLAAGPQPRVQQQRRFAAIASSMARAIADRACNRVERVLPFPRPPSHRPAPKANSLASRCRSTTEHQQGASDTTERLPRPGPHLLAANAPPRDAVIRCRNPETVLTKWFRSPALAAKKYTALRAISPHRVGGRGCNSLQNIFMRRKRTSMCRPQPLHDVNRAVFAVLKKGSRAAARSCPALAACDLIWCQPSRARGRLDLAAGAPLLTITAPTRSWVSTPEDRTATPTSPTGRDGRGTAPPAQAHWPVLSSRHECRHHTRPISTPGGSNFTKSSQNLRVRDQTASLRQRRLEVVIASWPRSLDIASRTAAADRHPGAPCGSVRIDGRRDR